MPADQPRHLTWTQDVDESPGLNSVPGCATVQGW